MLSDLVADFQKLRNPQKAKILSRFFKTGKGEYGEGDIFLGITVPQTRAIAKKYTHLNLKDLEKLLSSKIHEYRLIALLILIENYKKASIENKNLIFNFYIKNTKFINNWDLVDLSAPHIVGNFLLDKDKSILYNLAKSSNLWEKRIAIISTYAFIRLYKFKHTLKISEILMNDNHDLIHKAVGWMLREVGKRNKDVEEKFLNQHYKKMPRIMLRYAIEKFDNNKRKKYLERN